MTVVADKKVLVSDLHFELNLWLNELKFYKDEIKIFNRRLEDIVSRNTDKEVMRQIEHFQNQYIRQIEVIDELRHEVKQHENILEENALDNPIAVDHRYFEDHTELRDQADQFKKIYKELKVEFMRFLSKWM
jgi:hypothetical protein